MKQHPDNPSWEGRPAVTHPEGTRPLSRLSSRRLFLIGGISAIVAGSVFAPAVACSFVLHSTTLPQKDPHLFLDIPTTYGENPGDMAWSPDGKCIAVCNYEGVRVWDRQSGHQRWAYPPVLPKKDPQYPSPLTVAWSSDGRHLYYVYMNRLYALDAESGKPVWVDILPISVKTLGGHSLLAWSPDRTHFALIPHSGSVQDPVMIIWDISAHKQVAAYHFPVGSGSNGFSQLAWSSNGKHLASLNDSGVIQVWSLLENFSTWYALASAYQESQFTVRPWISWSPQGETLAGGCYLGGYTLWQASTGQILFQKNPSYPRQWGSASSWMSPDGTASSLWSPDGTRLALFVPHDDDKTTQLIQIWNIRTHQLLFTCQGASQPFNNAAWSPDGKYLAACFDGEAAQDSGIQIWATRTGKVLASYRAPFMPNDLIWSPDSRFLAVYNATGENCTNGLRPTCFFTNYAYQVFRVG